MVQYKTSDREQPSSEEVTARAERRFAKADKQRADTKADLPREIVREQLRVRRAKKVMDA
jgi:hypothetical protein